MIALWKLSPGPKAFLLAFSLVAIAVLSFLIHYIPYSETPYAVGQDGYYHIIQSRSILNNGAPYDPDSSIMPYFFAFFYKLVGNWETAQKLFICLLCAIFCLLVFIAGYLAGRNIGDDRQKACIDSLVLSLCMVTSPTITFLSFQYMKQFLGVLVLIIFLIFLLQYSDKRIRRQLDNKQTVFYFSALVGIALLAFMTHRVTGVFAFLGFLFIMNRRLVIIGSAVGLAALIAGSMFIPGVLGILDLERFKGGFTPIPSFHPLDSFKTLPFNPGWFLEMLLPYGALIAGAILLLKKKLHFHFVYFLLVLFFGIFPFLRSDNLDLAFRIFILSIPVAYILLFIIGKLINIPPGYFRLLFILFCLIMLPFCTGVFKQHTQLPYDRFNQVIDNTEMYFSTNNIQPELLIVHHGLNFYYIYRTSRYAFPFVPEWSFNPSNTYRLAYRLEDSEIIYYLPENPVAQPVRVDRDYVLFREDIWQDFKTACRNSDRMSNKTASFFNPDQQRPAYLRKFTSKVATQK